MYLERLLKLIGMDELKLEDDDLTFYKYNEPFSKLEYRKGTPTYNVMSIIEQEVMFNSNITFLHIKIGRETLER